MSAHVHEESEIPENCRMHYTCPSIVGPDAYAKGALSRGSEPSQILLAVTKTYGVIAKHTLYADEKETSPFVYDVDLLVNGAFVAMEQWRTEVLPEL